ncbi:hypothetical protein GCM10023259_058220 [Thermocatellispora tengchongensis]
MRRRRETRPDDRPAEGAHGESRAGRRAQCTDARDERAHLTLGRGHDAGRAHPMAGTTTGTPTPWRRDDGSAHPVPGTTNAGHDHPPHPSHRTRDTTYPRHNHPPHPPHPTPDTTNPRHNHPPQSAG